MHTRGIIKKNACYLPHLHWIQLAQGRIQEQGKEGAKSIEREKCGVTPTSGAVGLGKNPILSQEKSHLRLQTATNSQLAKPSDLPQLVKGHNCIRYM